MSSFMNFKKTTALLTLLFLVTIGIFSCQKEEQTASTEPENALSTQIIQKIRQMGFSTQNLKHLKEENRYLVEGDILLSDEDLNTTSDTKFLRVGQEEQYRTTNLVRGLPRQITVSISSSLPSSYVSALDVAISRYNAQGLTISFRRVSSGANISIVRSPSSASYLASAGFPTSSGNPYNQILINSTYLGSGTSTAFINYVGSILAHEIGHCIGFRHTDYADRSYSCGGQYTNEGASTVGAIQIPGTPAGADPNSWMLACIGTNQNRPFNSNDVIALNYLY
jgi:hypothetical protein